MTVDKENLAQHLDHLKKYIKQLNILKRQHTQKDFLDDWQVEDKISRKLQIALECMLDIGDLIINGYDFEKPETYKNVVEILAEHHVLPKDEKLKFVEMAKFRNVLVHDYLYLDRQLIWNHFIEDIKYLEKFLRYVVDFVKV